MYWVKQLGKCALLSLLAILITISYFLHQYPIQYKVLGFSPSFSRQEIADDIRDGINVNGVKLVQTADEYGDTLDNSTDIQRVTYLSNGTNLNATLWLGDNIGNSSSMSVIDAAVYGMLINVDSNSQTGKEGVDYQMEIQWHNETKNWNKVFVEYSSLNQSRVLDIERNHTASFGTNAPYAMLSLDLNDIGFPGRFKVMYYAIVVYDNSNMIIDLTSWIDIPPEKFSLSTLPSPVVLRQGEQKNIGVQLESSSSGLIPKVVDYLPINNYPNMEVQSDEEASSNNNSSSTTIDSPAAFKIKASENAQIGQYVVPVRTNISTGSNFPSKFLQLANLNFSIPAEGNIVQEVNLTISVVEPLTFQEQTKEFWSAYGAIISLVGAGFGGAIATYVFDYFKNRKMAKKRTPI